jgi:hypothetical protein
VIPFALTSSGARIRSAKAALESMGRGTAFLLESETMFLYETLLAIGVLGIIAMTVMGFAHVGGAHHGSHSVGGHAGHAHLAGHHAAGGHVAHHTGAHAVERVLAGSAARAGVGRALLALLSPMTLFAACLGAGLLGSLLTSWGVGPVLAGFGAVGGAVVSNALLVRPVMRLVMGFASEPARGLEGALMESAEAITSFDANGEGLVRVLVDGQSVDVLARLTEEERREGARVLRGQSVRIEDVDTHSNRCKVSRL